MCLFGIVLKTACLGSPAAAACMAALAVNIGSFFHRLALRTAIFLTFRRRATAVRVSTFIGSHRHLLPVQGLNHSLALRF